MSNASTDFVLLIQFDVYCNNLLATLHSRLTLYLLTIPLWYRTFYSVESRIDHVIPRYLSPIFYHSLEFHEHFRFDRDATIRLMRLSGLFKWISAFPKPATTIHFPFCHDQVSVALTVTFAFQKTNWLETELALPARCTPARHSVVLLLLSYAPFRTCGAFHPRENLTAPSLRPPMPSFPTSYSMPRSLRAHIWSDKQHPFVFFQLNGHAPQRSIICPDGLHHTTQNNSLSLTTWH